MSYHFRNDTCPICYKKIEIYDYILGKDNLKYHDKCYIKKLKDESVK